MERGVCALGDGLYGKYKMQPRGGVKGSGFSGFVLTFLWSLVLRVGWSIPAWGLLVAHFFLQWPLWAFWLALGLWLGYVLLVTLLIVWANHVGNEPPEDRPNKNPYSVTSNEQFLKKR